MPVTAKRSKTEKKVQDLLQSAKDALAEGVERVEHFTDSKDFHQSLVRALDKHQDFKNAVRDFHLHSVSGNGARNDHGKGQVPRQVVPAGRVQAPRRDTPKGRALSSSR
jgi:hypothetical protein